MNETEAKLRALSAAHPPVKRTVGATRYGTTGTGVGTTNRDRNAYARQRYRDNKDSILAAQRKMRIDNKARAARELKRARGR
jgi:adenylosuccinate synthase